MSEKVILDVGAGINAFTLIEEAERIEKELTPEQKAQRDEEIRKIFQKSDDECLRDLYKMNGAIKWPISEDWK